MPSPLIHLPFHRTGKRLSAGRAHSLFSANCGSRNMKKLKASGHLHVLCRISVIYWTLGGKRPLRDCMEVLQVQLHAFYEQTNSQRHAPATSLPGVFVFRLFTDALNDIGCKTSHEGTMIVIHNSSELERMWKRSTITYFQVLF
jgi:hypothetical protein